MAPRRKAPKIDAPATLEEAIGQIADYLEASAAIDQIRADADASIRQIEEARDAMTAPVEEALKVQFAQLRTWWAVARVALTDGKKKSVELAGALIGDRTTTPRLKLPRGKPIDDLIADLADEYDEQFVTVKYQLNKPALIAALRAPVGRLQEQLICDFHLTTEQRDEFFITRAAEKQTDPVLEQECMS